MSQAVYMSWYHCSDQHEHECAITAWALSLVPEICNDVLERLTGNVREKIETVINRLHTPPCPNTKVANDSNVVIIDHFWKEFQHFQHQPGSFAKFKGRFSVNGNSFVWHQFYSLRYTKVLGFAACRTTSKQLGIGSAEWYWSDIKQIKNGKQSNLGGASLEKRAILYSSVKFNEAKMRANHSEDGENDVFGDDDIK